MLSFSVEIIVVACCIEVLGLAKKEEEEEERRNRGFNPHRFATLENLVLLLRLLYVVNSFCLGYFRTKRSASAWFLVDVFTICLYWPPFFWCYI